MKKLKEIEPNQKVKKKSKYNIFFLHNIEVSFKL